MEPTIKPIYKSKLTLGLYSIGLLCLQFIIEAVHDYSIPLLNLPGSLATVLAIAVYIIAAKLLYSHANYYKFAFVTLKQKYKNITSHAILKIIGLILITIIINGVYLGIFGTHVQGTSNNQEMLSTYTKLGPSNIVYLWFLSLIIGPTIEELVFRVTLIGQDTKNKYIEWLKLAYSSALFSLIHNIAQSQHFLLYFGSYFILGMSLGLVWKTYRNYKMNVTFHFIYNLLVLLAM